MSRFHTILKHTFKIALKVFSRAVNLKFVTYCSSKLSTTVCSTFNVLFMTGLLNWFMGTESIALKINSESFEIYIIYIYLKIPMTNL